MTEYNSQNTAFPISQNKTIRIPDSRLLYQSIQHRLIFVYEMRWKLNFIISTIRMFSSLAIRIMMESGRWNHTELPCKGWNGMQFDCVWFDFLLFQTSQGFYAKCQRDIGKALLVSGVSILDFVCNGKYFVQETKTGNRKLWQIRREQNSSFVNNYHLI